MKSVATLKQSSSISHWLWEKRLNHQYTPHAGYIGDGHRLRLLLGIQGKGLNHLARLITQDMPNSQYHNEPLEKFQPKLTLSDASDRMAIPYQKDLQADHPLVRVYRIMVEHGIEWTSFTGHEADSNALYIKPLLVKETHSLLATEALLRELGCHVLLYLSDPVILADQLFTQEGLDTPYFDLESQSVLQADFLQRFLRHDTRAVLRTHKVIQSLPSARQRRIQTKVLTIALIQHMFRMLAARYPELATIVDYTQLEKAPTHLQFPIVNWLGDKGGDFATHLLTRHTFTPNGHNTPRWKSSWPEAMLSFETLMTQEVNTAYQLLIDCGLMRDEGATESQVGRMVAQA